MKRSDVNEEELLLAIRDYHKELRNFFVGNELCAVPKSMFVSPVDRLAHRYPRKIILAKMRQLIDRGALEYGVSEETAWIVRDSK